MSQYNERDARYVPDDTPAAPPAVPTDPTAPGAQAQTTINKAAKVDDAYNGGLKITRDTSNLIGGIPGHVNTANYTYTLAGQSVSAFEWGRVSVLDNHAIAGENVADYSQANRYSIGPTWGAVTEVCDTAGRAGLTVSHEFDVWTTGPDTGTRYGVWPVLGDAREIRGLGPSEHVGGSAAIRLEAMPRTVWTRGIQFIGKFIVGVDFSTAESIQTPIRLKAGQAISFDEYDSMQVKLSNGRVQFTAYGRPMFEIDMATGDTYKMGARQG